MIRLPRGTVEYLVVDVTDLLGTITTLDGTAPKYDVYDQEGTQRANQLSAINQGMRCLCLLDTTLWGFGKHELWLNFSSPPENPKLGPFPFMIVEVP